MSDLKKEIFHTSGKVDLTDSGNVLNLIWYLEKLENRIKELEEKLNEENIVGEFSKVSLEQFTEDFLKSFNSYTEDEIKEIYDKIFIPKRATEGSAGYDFFAPIDIIVPFGTSLVIPTGIRCNIKDNWFLDLNPRGGHGFKYGISIANTRGIVDSDYFYATNEGHIMLNIVNNNSAVNTDKTAFKVEKGKGYCQGIFTIYGFSKNDNVDTKRTYGFGSTDKNWFKNLLLFVKIKHSIYLNIFLWRAKNA